MSAHTDPFGMECCLTGHDALSEEACIMRNYLHEMKRAGLSGAVSDTAPLPQWALQGLPHPDLPVATQANAQAQGLPVWALPALVIGLGYAAWRGR